MTHLNIGNVETSSIVNYDIPNAVGGVRYAWKGKNISSLGQKIHFLKVKVIEFFRHLSISYKNLKYFYYFIRN